MLLQWRWADSFGSVVIAFGTDEETELTRRIVEDLRAQGHQVTEPVRGAQWPEVGRAVGEAVSSGQADRGIVCCFTGTGVSIAANKVAGARAALCTDAATAAGARRWNDANVLALGLRLTSVEVAREVVEAFLSTPVDAAEQDAICRVEPALG